MYETDKIQVRKEPIWKRTVKRVFKGLYDIIETLVIALAVVVFLYLFVASPHEVIGSSMETNFWTGQYLLADKISYHFTEPRRGDVVIFKQTETADYIKRIIGTPGDTVEIRDGYFYVNSDRLDETEYLDESEYTRGKSFLSEGDSYTVKEGEVFAVGDNRDESSDSREFGPVKVTQIKGRAVLIYWPINQFEIIKRPTYRE